MKRILVVVMIVSIVLSMFAVLAPKVCFGSDPFSLLWTENTGETVCSIAVGDINRDGKNEVVYSD